MGTLGSGGNIITVGTVAASVGAMVVEKAEVTAGFAEVAKDCTRSVMELH